MVVKQRDAFALSLPFEDLDDEEDIYNNFEPTYEEDESRRERDEDDQDAEHAAFWLSYITHCGIPIEGYFKDIHHIYTNHYLSFQFSTQADEPALDSLPGNSNMVSPDQER